MGDIEETRLIVKLQVPGFHRWENAPTICKYLSQWHRHVFYITCSITVEKNREFEFILVKDSLINHLNDKFGVHTIAAGKFLDDPDSPSHADLYLHKNHLIFTEENINMGSCEGIAKYIAKFLCKGNSTVSVEVLEDNENGAEVIIYGGE